MKSNFMQKSVVAMIVLAAFASFAGCDKADKVLDKTNLKTSTEITKLVGRTAELLGGIKDIDSAKAALPALKNVDVDLGNLVQKVAEMSPEQKSQLTGAVSKAMPALESAIAKVSSLAGVGDIVGPTLESLQNKFKSLT